MNECFFYSESYGLLDMSLEYKFPCFLCGSPQPLTIFFFNIFSTGIQVLQGAWASCWLARLWLLFGHVESGLHVCWNGITHMTILPIAAISSFSISDYFLIDITNINLLIIWCWLQIFRKEPFFYGHDNHDQLVKIAKVDIQSICSLQWTNQLAMLLTFPISCSRISFLSTATAICLI